MPRLHLSDCHLWLGLQGVARPFPHATRSPNNSSFLRDESSDKKGKRVALNGKFVFSTEEILKIAQKRGSGDGCEAVQKTAVQA